MTPIPPGDSMRREHLKLLELHNRNRIDYNDRKWETVKFFQSIFVAFLGGSVVALYNIWNNICDNWLVGLTAAALPLLGAVSAYLGQLNLYRESRLLFMEEGQMFKLARLLDLDRHVEERDRWLRGDQYLLMKKWRSPMYGTKGLRDQASLEDWVDARMRGHRFADIFRILFYLEALVGVVFAALVFLVLLKCCWMR